FIGPLHLVCHSREGFVYLAALGRFILIGGRRKRCYCHSWVREHFSSRFYHRGSPFEIATSLTTGRHLLALVRGTRSTISIFKSRPGRLAVTMDSICRRFSSPKPSLGTSIRWTE